LSVQHGIERPGIATVKAYVGVPLDMGRIERPDPDPFDRSVVADVLLRQEPDEEDDEGQDKGDGDEDDNGDKEDDEGYSE
jgi:hypothetical protein